MNVEALDIEGFRNLQPVQLIPGSGVNILYGDNAQGKTNLLEAVWLFTGGRSFRSAKDTEMVAFGQEKARCRMAFQAADRAQDAEITIDRRRHAVLNGIPMATAAKLAGIFCAIVFSPEHLTLIKGGPEGRRRFLDAAYCQIRPGYIAILSAFHRTLTQRNALLREIRARRAADDLLEIWDQRLAQTGAQVQAARAAYVQQLQPLAGKIYGGLSAQEESLTISYEGRTGGDAEGLYRRLGETRQADIGAGFTTTGPHREELTVEINGLAARQYGSQGQQRSAVLALKMAEATLLKKVTGEQPVALLDDVMSELDITRQDYILNHIHDWQVFITCCDPSAMKRLDGGRVFHVEKGMIRPE